MKAPMIPKIAWAAFWRSHPERWRSKVAMATERAIRGGLLPGRSPALVWIVDIGADLHPDYVTGYIAIITYVRLLWGRFSVLSTNAVPLAAGGRERRMQLEARDLDAPWVTDRFLQVMKEWQWHLDADGTTAHTPLGILDLRDFCPMISTPNLPPVVPDILSAALPITPGILSILPLGIASQLMGELSGLQPLLNDPRFQFVPFALDTVSAALPIGPRLLSGLAFNITSQLHFNVCLGSAPVDCIISYYITLHCIKSCYITLYMNTLYHIIS